MYSQNFINLRSHTNYSLAEGMLTSNYIADFCVNDMQPACAITDTSNLFGAFEFSEKFFSSGIKPIIGWIPEENNFSENSNAPNRLDVSVIAHAGCMSFKQKFAI